MYMGCPVSMAATGTEEVLEMYTAQVYGLNLNMFLFTDVAPFPGATVVWTGDVHCTGLGAHSTCCIVRGFSGDWR